MEVTEHRGDLRSSREESGEDVGRDLREGEVMTLSIKHVDDLIEAHEITDEGQILAVAGLIRVREGSSELAITLRESRQGALPMLTDGIELRGRGCPVV